MINLEQISIGSWCQVGHPANAEILAKAGYDWIAADCEHGEFNESELGNFCRAIRQEGCSPLVRVRENATLPIRRALDLGAAGVFVPLVNSAEEAERAVQAAKYPPEGVRGFAYHRGNSWGVDFDEYAKTANQSTVVIVMVESRQAVESIDEILAVDGVDGVFIGPYDMCGSYGIPGEVGNQIIIDACQTVADACKRHGKAAGQHIVVPTAENVKKALDQGYSLLALGMDTVFLAKGAKAARELTK